MADLKISDLVAANTVESGDYFIINKGDASTQKISTGKMSSAFGNRSFMVNFPTDPGFSFSTATGAHYMGAATASGSGTQFINTPELYDIFKDVVPVTITMPPGTDSAVVSSTYSVSVQTAPSVGSNSDFNGYANFGYEIICASNKGQVTWSPGAASQNRFAYGTRVFAPAMRYDQYETIPANVRDLRAPSNLHHSARSMRIYFPESTDAAPTTLTFSLFAQVFRTKHCRSSISTGKIAIHPYKDDALDDFGRAMVQLATTGDEFDGMDDGGLDIGYVEAERSTELKGRMNYLSNAIDESLRYDLAIVGNQPAEFALTGALNALFELKRNPSTDPQAYEAELDRIVAVATPYVGFQFGFETSGFTVPNF